MKRIAGAGRLPSWLLTASLLLTAGCAATTAFVPYPARINPLIEDVKQGRPFDADRLSGECRGRDGILYSLERGRLAQVYGNVEESMNDFRAALDAIGEKEERAVVSASRIGGQTAGLLLNDNAVPYMADGFERVLLHQFQAMNYLAEKDLEGAGVEIRCASAEQEDALKRHERELRRVEEEARQKKIDLGSDRLASAYAGLDEVAGKVKNSFQNAYTFYVSGLVHEIMGDGDDAYIDYKKALEIFPENTYLQRDLVRMARALGRDEELEAFRDHFRLETEDVQEATAGEEGELVVFFEDGLVPQKKEIKIPIPFTSGRAGGFTAVAFPIYDVKWKHPIPLSLSDEGRRIGATEPICYVDALAARALKEEVPSMLVRQILRSTAKGAAVKEAREKLGPFGELGASLLNLASENADLRSWVSLPAVAQILRTRLAPGKHRLSLMQGSEGEGKEVEVEIRKGARTILRVVRAGERFYAMDVVF